MIRSQNELRHELLSCIYRVEESGRVIGLILACCIHMTDAWEEKNGPVVRHNNSMGSAAVIVICKKSEGSREEEEPVSFNSVL